MKMAIADYILHKKYIFPYVTIDANCNSYFWSHCTNMSVYSREKMAKLVGVLKLTKGIFIGY